MEEYFLHAIHLAFDPLSDPGQKKEADVYLRKLQTTNEGWNLCQTLLSLPPDSVSERLYHTFWAFQLIVNQLPLVRSRMSSADARTVYGWVRQWVINVCCQVPVAHFVRNKCAQAMVVYLQVAEGLPAWTEFFQDTFHFLDIRCPQQVQIVELWLRLLQCIDERVVDREQPRSREEHNRDTLIKDTMREVVIPRAVQIWFSILSSAHESHTDIARLCLEVVEPYVIWIDITLVTTKEWVSMLYFFLTKSDLQVGAADCMIQIVEKKMTLLAKRELIVQLGLLDALPHIAPIAVDIANRHGEEEPFPGKITHLAVCVGVLLCDMTESGDVSADAPLMCTHICDVVLPLFSANTILSEKAYEFLLRYLNLLKRGQISVNTSTITRMITAVHLRCLLPASPPESEKIFNEYRKSMFNLLRSVGRVNAESCSDITLSMLQDVHRQGRDCSLQMAEGALRIVYELGEGMRPEMARDPKIRVLIDEVVSIPFLEHSYDLVHAAYFEVLDRYAVCFCQGAGPAVGVILQSFLEHRHGVRHPVDPVRYRICYLFSRMCAALRQPFSAEASRIMDSLRFVLHTGPEAMASPDDKACLFEGLGVVLWHDEHGIHRIREVVNAVADNTSSNMRRDDMTRESIVTIVVGNLSAFVGLTKTIGSNERSHLALLQDVTDFVTNKVLHPMSDNFQVRDKVLSYYQQYVNSSAGECVAFFQQHMPFLLQTTNGFEFSKILRLCTQIVQRTKAQAVELVGSNLGAIADLVLSLEASECTNPQNVGFQDDYKGPLDILKSYFQLLYNLGQYECVAAVHPGTFDRHLDLLLNGVVTHPEFDLSKMCIGTLVKFTGQVQVTDQQSGRIIRAIMSQMIAPYFNARDAKSWLLLLEAMTVLHTLASSGGRDARSLSEPISSVVGPQKGEAIAKAIHSAKDPAQARKSIVDILHSN